MYAAQIHTWGQAPTYTSLPSPPPPPTSPETTQITLLATALHRLVRSRASGRHYTTTALPHTPGVDGIGLTPSGQTVYFSTLEAPTGSFATILHIPQKDTLPLPAGLSPIRAAALGNLGMSSWMALRLRCENLPAGFSALILGATTASGRVAIHLARYLGAKRVIGVGRDAAKLQALGLDESIVLGEPAFEALGHVDVVLDYLGGAPATALLRALPPAGGRVQYVHIGGLAAAEVVVPGSVLRGKDIVIRGSGLGSFEQGDMWREMGAMFEALVGWEGMEFRVERLEDVERVWGEGGAERVVFVP
ncbi:MAG: hypothetical protein Q9195_003831 [Heterodermia aff. obscurata]